MISRLSVQRVTLNVSHDRAKHLIEAVARNNGFEITSEVDLCSFVRKRTGMDVDRKSILLQLHIPSLILGGTLLDDNLPLLLPVRMILREISESLSELDYPDWDVTKSVADVNAQHCMDIVYTHTVGRLTTAIRKSLTENDTASTLVARIKVEPGTDAAAAGWDSALFLGIVKSRQATRGREIGNVSYISRRAVLLMSHSTSR